MTALPGWGLVVAGMVFLVIGFSGDRSAFLGVGVAFLVIGLGTLRRGRPPAP